MKDAGVKSEDVAVSKRLTVSPVVIAIQERKFWKTVDLPEGTDEFCVCIGVKTSNHFMPKKTSIEEPVGRDPVARQRWLTSMAVAAEVRGGDAT